jgi:restriction system protein
MPVPDFQTLMLPVLRELGDGRERVRADVRDAVADTRGLSDADRAELLPSGQHRRYANRIAWAFTYLRQAGLLQSVRRGVYRLTDRGRSVLAAPPERITIAFLRQFPEFLEFQGRHGAQTSDSDAATEPSGVEARDVLTLTPDEQIRAGYDSLRRALAGQLLDRIKQASPEFFEQLVVHVLVAMGYGGTEEDAARVVGKSGDGGIDGIIKEDRLGLESIYIQAKRYTDGSVGRPEIQQFAGALQGHRARKGVFITTSAFSKSAVDYAAGLQNTIVLVDGAQLAELMIDYGVGVSEVQTIRIMRLDEDWFGEE